LKLRNRLRICNSEILCHSERNDNKTVIYPNPANDFVWVKNLNNETIDNIEVLSIEGKLIKSVPVNTTIHKIDIHDLNTGIYLLKINQKENSKIVRLSVVK
jgi:hypothetical protein